MVYIVGICELISRSYVDTKRIETGAQINITDFYYNELHCSEKINLILYPYIHKYRQIL